MKFKRHDKVVVIARGFAQGYTATVISYDPGKKTYLVTFENSHLESPYVFHEHELSAT
jgi:hypothetical protein